MRYIITSRGRSDYQLTLSSLPDELKKHVELWVPKSELSDYENSPHTQGVESIHTWPKAIDCIPKKRLHLAQTLKEPFMVLDDDLNLRVWVAAEGKYFGPDSSKKARSEFTRHFLETAPKLLDSFGYASFASKFMAESNIKKNGSLLARDAVGFCFSGFNKLSLRPDFHTKPFFFTDISMPLQVIQNDQPTAIHYGISYDMRSNKKLHSTGTTPYRDDITIKYSAIAMARMFPGIVTGLKYTGNSGGGWSLEKGFSRATKGVTVNSLLKTHEFLRTIMKQEGLVRLPKLIDLDPDTPLADLKKQYEGWFARARTGASLKYTPYPEGSEDLNKVFFKLLHTSKLTTC